MSGFVRVRYCSRVAEPEPAAASSRLLRIGMPAAGGLMVGLAAALIVGFSPVPATSGDAIPQPGETPEVAAEQLAAIQFDAADLRRLVWSADDLAASGLLTQPYDRNVTTAPDDYTTFTTAMTPASCQPIGYEDPYLPLDHGTTDDPYVDVSHYPPGTDLETSGVIDRVVIEIVRAYPSIAEAQAAVAEIRDVQAACPSFDFEPLGYNHTGLDRATRVLDTTAPEPIESFSYMVSNRQGVDYFARHLLRLGNTVVVLQVLPDVDYADGLRQSAIDRMLWLAAAKIQAGAS